MESLHVGGRSHRSFGGIGEHNVEQTSASNAFYKEL